MLRTLAAGLLLVCALAVALVAATALWSERQLLDEGAGPDAAAAILRAPAVQDAVVDELAAHVPASVADRTRAEQAARTTLNDPAFAALWRTTTQSAQRQLVRRLEDDRGALVRDGVALDLRPELDLLAARAGLPPLPAGTDTTTRILTGDELEPAWRAVDALHRVRVVAPLLVVALLLGAALVARDHLLGLAGGGLVLVAAGVVLLVARHQARVAVADAVVQGGGRRAIADAAFDAATSTLPAIGIGVIAIGALLTALTLAVRAGRPEVRPVW